MKRLRPPSPRPSSVWLLGSTARDARRVQEAVCGGRDASVDAQRHLPRLPRRADMVIDYERPDSIRFCTTGQTARITATN